MSQVEKQKPEIIYNRLLPHVFTIPAAWATLTVFSALFWKKAYLIHSLGIMRRHLAKSINLKQAQNLQENQLVYIHGKIEKSSQNLVKDPLYGVSAKPQSIGLYRKYELYARLQYKEYGWININQMQNYIPNHIKHLQSNVIPDQEIKVENHTLSQPLLVELAEQHGEQIHLNPTQVDNHFEQLKEQFNNFRKQQQQQEIVLDNKAQKLYESHPYYFATSHYKDIYYDDNYIYICNSSDHLQENDIRISLHDIQLITDVTILALKNNNTLSQYPIPELINRDYYINIENHEGKKINKNLGIICYIQKGLMEHQDVIQKIFQQCSKESVKMTLLYAFAVYILYQFICEQIGPMIDFRHWNEEYINELAKKIVLKQGDKITVNDPQFNTMSVVCLSSAAHLGCNALFAAGHSSFLLLGFPILIYWIQASARKIELEQKIQGEINNLIEYSKQFENSQNQPIKEFSFFDKIEFVKN